MPSTQLSDLEDSISAEPYGCLIAFTHPEDAHSPVARPHYEDAVKRLNALFPIQLHEADATQLTDEERSDLLIYSTPTLLWIHRDGPQPRIYSRHVGTTTADKIYADIENRLDELLPD